MAPFLRFESRHVLLEILFHFNARTDYLTHDWDPYRFLFIFLAFWAVSFHLLKKNLLVRALAPFHHSDPFPGFPLQGITMDGKNPGQD